MLILMLIYVTYNVLVLYCVGSVKCTSVRGITVFLLITGISFTDRLLVIQDKLSTCCTWMIIMTTLHCLSHCSRLLKVLFFLLFHKKNTAYRNYKYMWVCSLNKNILIIKVLILIKIFGYSVLATLVVYGLMVVEGDALLSADFLTNS